MTLMFDPFPARRSIDLAKSLPEEGVYIKVAAAVTASDVLASIQIRHGIIRCRANFD